MDPTDLFLFLIFLKVAFLRFLIPYSKFFEVFYFALIILPLFVNLFYNQYRTGLKGLKGCIYLMPLFLIYLFTSLIKVALSLMFNLSYDKALHLLLLLWLYLNFLLNITFNVTLLVFTNISLLFLISVDCFESKDQPLPPINKYFFMLFSFFPFIILNLLYFLIIISECTTVIFKVQYYLIITFKVFIDLSNDFEQSKLPLLCCLCDSSAI